MSYIIDKVREKALLALAPALLLAVLAVVPSIASATKVTPAGTPVEATLRSPFARFNANNGFNPLSVRCMTSSANAAVPSENTELQNMNRGPSDPAPAPVGTYSQGYGSVTTPLEPVGGEPARFGACEVFNEENGTRVFGPSEVGVTSSGTWKLSLDEFELPAEGEGTESGDARVAAIGVAPDGVSITTPPCTITVSPGEASPVLGRWTNGSDSEGSPSWVRFDDQIQFEGCELLGFASPAQFEADYNLRTSPEGTTPVLVNR